MKRVTIKYRTLIDVVQENRQAESIEEMLRRVRNSKEPIEAKARVNYTERKDGVLPMYDIRTDRFDYAMSAADRVHATKFAQRMAEDGFEMNDKGQWVQNKKQEGGEGGAASNAE